jgi:ankyrin repeat protein
MGSTEELFEAIGSGDVETVRSLLAAEPDLAAARDAEGVSALMRARYRLNMSLTQAILDAVPPLDVFEAASFGDLDHMTELFVEAPSLATAFSADGFTPLHLAAFFGKAEAAGLLLAHGADVDARGRGWMTGTPLHSAASSDHTDVARMLLEAGAEPNAQQSGGWTPLHSAARNGNLELVGLLLACGADPAAENDDGSNVLALAEEGGGADVIERIRIALGV